MKKKIDERIRILIDNCVKQNHRSLFLIVGDRGLYQIVNLHMLLSKSRVRAAPRVLWCYKNELEIASNKKKRVKQIRKMEQKGNLAKDEIDQIELFMSSKDIRYCFYKDSHQILGQTFGMCVLQDFESITPNVLCRAMETVEGGGCIVMLFNTLTSLKQLYSISMDVHNRFRTEAHQVVQPRFNERFILSLSNCKTCIAIDDELNILPLTQNIANIEEVRLPGQAAAEASGVTDDLYLTKDQKELKDLKVSLKSTRPIGNLVDLCKTFDQASTVMQIVDNISERSLKSTISLTAGRGRGKSAALGISLASAIVYGFSNIFVTAPSPENLGTVFEFLFKGLDALGYREHMDYDILQSTNPDFNHAVVRVNVFKNHRQTIQYIQPQDYGQLTQAELLMVDEAAAIPITLVKQMLGPYMVVLSSTIHGYEGTGRSLSLKLLNSLREQNQQRVQHQKAQASSLGAGRSLMETSLEEPIRYGKNDPVERWLSDLLCLDATQNNDNLVFGFPHPSQCELYFVNRDTLFSYHASSESFLNKLMTIFVASHYKNTPNDLQLLSDAPAHQVFVLMGPLEEATAHNKLPDILCAIQVSFEGEISKKNIAEQLRRGLRPSGDLIPWTISEQFQDDKFGQLNGIRIVRIATHPSAQGRGYGSRALDMLIKYYEGQLLDADSPNITQEAEQFKPAKAEKADHSGAVLKDERLKPKKKLKPILQKLSERVPVPVHYLGTSFGVTKELFNFWKKNRLEPVYVRQTANDLTGEHTCLMIRPLNHLQEVSLPQEFQGMEKDTWLEAYQQDFRRRIVALLGFEFRKLPAGLAFLFVARRVKENPDGNALAAIETGQDTAAQSISREMLERHITVFDLKRLESYAKNLVDFHLIMDLVPTLAKLHFLILPQGTISLSYVQAATLAGMGLQYKTVDQLTIDLNLQANQILPLFNKAIRKFTRLIKEVFEFEIAAEMNRTEQQASKMLGNLAQNKEAASTLGTTTLGNELEVAAATPGLGTKMAQKMQDDKDRFISQHKLKKSQVEGLEGVKLGDGKSIVSIPRKARSKDDDEDGNLAAIEQKVRSKKGDKGFNNKRQRTK